jgi:DNA-binding PucR family transcriptional regulator
MQQRRRERELRTSEMFDPLGFEGLFKVEMQVLGYRRMADIALHHQRQRDDALRQLYIAADQVIAATVAFHMVDDDGALDPIDDASWLSIAQRMYPELDEATRPRVALIRLLEAPAVLALNNEWYAWNTRGNAEVERELGADLSGTG